MDQLYSPWRIDYILKKKKNTCIFCEKPKEDNDEKHLILKRGSYCYVVMNLYPYNNSHLMVVPYRHVNDLSDLNELELVEMTEMVILAENVVKKAYHPEGFNIGINIGEAAGAGISEHLHIHIVPRWIGDTNFVSTIAKTRVIPEKMERCYKKLKAFFNEKKKK